MTFYPAQNGQQRRYRLRPCQRKTNLPRAVRFPRSRPKLCPIRPKISDGRVDTMTLDITPTNATMPLFTVLFSTNEHEADLLLLWRFPYGSVGALGEKSPRATRSCPVRGWGRGATPRPTPRSIPLGEHSLTTNAIPLPSCPHSHFHKIANFSYQ